LPRYPTGPWWPGPVTATAAPPPLKGQTLGLRGVTALLAVEVVAELLAAVGVAELGQGLGLDLADALPGHPELLADLLEGAGLAVVEPEPQAHHRLLPLVELVEGVDDGPVEHAAGGGVGGGLGGLVLD